MRPISLSLAAAALLAAGAAGYVALRDDAPSDAERIEEATRKLATIPLPSVGLGEAGPPQAVTEGWKTNFGKRLVPLEEFQPGGPGKDGIPAIDVPRFAPASEIRFLRPQEPVVELVVGGRARAYPLQILVWHEIVNDRIDGVPVAVTFCPLCNTAIAFDRRVGSRTLDLGVSGNLRNSDLVMFDRQTESWWQQFGGLALVGDLAGARLRKLPARIVGWATFRAAHPNGLVLTRETGHPRSYGANPYPGYDDVSSPPFFHARNSGDDRLPAKERVVFLERGGEAAAVPYSTLARRPVVSVRLGGATYVVRASGRVTSPLDDTSVAGGREILSVDVRVNGRPATFEEPFWFAVAAFRPDTRIVR
jgi:hypothetical protein